MLTCFVLLHLEDTDIEHIITGFKINFEVQLVMDYLSEFGPFLHVAVWYSG